MDIAQTIKQRAQERGVDPELALAIAQAESRLRPQVKNPKSSAHGLFQIVDDTWKQYGGDPKKRKDVNENIRIGLEILANNQQALTRTLGREPRPGELYAAHFFGTEGAKRVLTANPDAPVSSVVSARVLKANPELLQGKSVSQALSALSAKVGDTGPGQSIPRAPAPKTASPASREDPAKPPVISNAIDATNQYGPGYQAALALSYLSDTEEESDDPDAPSVVEREARAEMQAQALAASSQPRAASMLAEMDFGYAPVVTAAQPQQAPVRMNQGGEVSDPEAQLVMGAERRAVSPAQFGRGMINTAAGMLKGSAQAAVGMPGDIESLIRMLAGSEGQTLPTTDRVKAFIDKYAPLGLPADEGTDGRTAAEYFGEFMSPAAATRPLVRGAQAVGSGVMEGAQRAEKALDPVVTRTMERGGKAAEMLQAMSPAPARAVPQGSTQSPTASFTPLPTAEAPFVGRLDQFAANMQSPMKKDQLLGMLGKGKFKDYEVERARVALQDMPDDAKVMPTDFLNRLNNVHNPAGYRTTVLEPQQGSFYQSMDNVFVDGEKTPPMGVIHLTKFIDPKTAASMSEADKAGTALYALSRARYEPEAMPSLLNWAQSQPDGVHITRLLTTGPLKDATDKLKQVDALDDLRMRLIYPSIHKDVGTYADAFSVQMKDNWRPGMYEEYMRGKEELAQSIHKEGLRRAQELGLRLPAPPEGVGLNDLPFKGDYKDIVMSALGQRKDQLRGAAHDDIYQVASELGDLRERVHAGGAYMGQHSSLKNPPLPIAFSRYTEREAVIPGMGKAKGIYVHELQSDLLDDVRKRGAKGGSDTKDYAELKKVEEKLANRTGMDDSEVFSLLGRRRVLEQRLDNGPYSSEANYRLEEAIPNMEQSPQVVQQLMVKNAVSAAIQRGDQFVAFPGKESAQAQLYEKLPRNLDAVVKDLGPGFEKRSIEMTLPNGEPALFNAIVWAPEAAQKLQKSGIPFAKGGMVERNNHDNRSYK